MKKLAIILLTMVLCIPLTGKPKRPIYVGDAIVSNVENVNFDDMSERELFHFMFENTQMIRPINVSIQDTLRKLSNYEKYILAKEGKEIPTEVQDTVVIHDTIYIEVEAEQSQDVDIYVNTYPTYGRFYTPYFSHNWYGYGYDPFFYDPYFSYGYSYGYHNHWYNPWYSPYYYRPIYVYNTNRYRQGVATGTLGSRRYTSNPNPWNRTYSNGYITAPNKSGVKNMSTTRTIASQQRATVQKNIQASQRPTYSKAVENGRTYTPTYSNPRMKVRPDYNNSNTNNRSTQVRTQTRVQVPSKSVQARTQTPNRNTTQSKTQTQSRYSTPVRTQTQSKYSTPARTQTQTQNRSTVNRSSIPSRSTGSSINRSSGSSVSRSGSTTSRSSSSGGSSSGKKR